MESKSVVFVVWLNFLVLRNSVIVMEGGSKVIVIIILIRVFESFEVIESVVVVLVVNVSVILLSFMIVCFISLVLFRLMFVS